MEGYQAAKENVDRMEGIVKQVLEQEEYTRISLAATYMALKEMDRGGKAGRYLETIWQRPADASNCELKGFWE